MEFLYWLIPLILVILIALIIVFWWISTFNALQRMKVKVQESASGIDVALTKRFDLLTKAVAAVKGYTAHEKETLIGVVKMRQPGQDSSMADKSAFNGELAKLASSLNVVVEKYPELKADTQFSKLQSQISDVEEQLQAARRVYNSNVSAFNQTLLVFPSSVVANHYKFTAFEFFEAEESKRQDVKIEF